MKRPYAYLRKSVVEKNKRLLSPEVQEAEVRKMAARYEDEDTIVVLSDIGRSGKNTKRPGYRELVENIKDGRVSALYAYSLSRLNRSVADYSDLVEVCVEHRVPIRLVMEGEQDFGSASGVFTSTVLAAAAQMQRQLDSERQKDNIRQRRANGEHHGARKYGHYEWESVDAVVDAFEAAGSVNGAARQLDAWGIPSRSGRNWAPSSVHRILREQRPYAFPAGTVERAKTSPPFLFARLLRCHCGKVMTGVRIRGAVRYRCHHTVIEGHGPASVSEARIFGAIADLWAAFDHSGLRLETETQDADRLDLESRVEKLSRQHEMGLLTDDQLARRIGEVQTALERLETRTVAANLPDDIEWGSDDPAAVNAVLRAAWDHVEMSADLIPVKAAWRFDPEAAR